MSGAKIPLRASISACWVIQADDCAEAQSEPRDARLMRRCTPPAFLDVRRKNTLASKYFRLSGNTSRLVKTYRRRYSCFCNTIVFRDRNLFLIVYFGWACSSAGRAPRSQRGGHGFEPHQVHQIKIRLHGTFISRKSADSGEKIPFVVIRAGFLTLFYIRFYP